MREEKALRGDMVMPCDRENQDSDPENLVYVALLSTLRIYRKIQFFK